MHPNYSDATLTVHLDAIAANYRLIAAHTGTAEVAAVVKANAYGLGVIPVAEHLAVAGCERFFVATLDEAIELRSALPSAKICVFHGARLGQEQAFLEHNLIPVLNDLGQLERWNALSALQPSRLHCLIHIDTGMNRLGLNISEAEALVQTPDKLRYIDIEAIISHLACGGHDHSFNQAQLAAFKQITKTITGTKYSLANSAGCFMGDAYHFDLVRPGCSLYGIWPMCAEDTSPLKHVVTLTARILQLRETDRDGTVGYGATAEVKKGAKLAVLPIGYADGYMRHLSNTGAMVSVAGTKVPLVGRVSMDMVIADVSVVPEGKLNLTTEAELIGDNSQTVDELAAKAGTIGYEILTGLGNRFRRMYTAE